MLKSSKEIGFDQKCVTFVHQSYFSTGARETKKYRISNIGKLLKDAVKQFGLYWRDSFTRCLVTVFPTLTTWKTQNPQPGPFPTGFYVKTIVGQVFMHANLTILITIRAYQLPNMNKPYCKLESLNSTSSARCKIS